MKWLVVWFQLITQVFSLQKSGFRLKHIYHHTLSSILLQNVSTVSHHHVLTFQQPQNDLFQPQGQFNLGPQPKLDQHLLLPNVSDPNTILALAEMANNAYHQKDGQKWIDVGNGWTVRKGFGWKEDGIRGYVYGNDEESLIVIVFKGTSASFFGIGGGKTSARDKLNDNLMFSCCCADVDVMWRPICKCADQHPLTNSPKKHTCSQSCFQSSLPENAYYYKALAIFESVKKKFPHSQIWVSGHSLGGALASLTAAHFGVPAVTFEAPGERLFASKIGLFPKRSDYKDVSESVWISMVDNWLNDLPIYHIGNAYDPIFKGECNGATSACYIAGYAMESKCHLGHVITYNYTASSMEMNRPINEQGLRQHQLGYLITTFLQPLVPVPYSSIEAECIECESWEFTI